MMRPSRLEPIEMSKKTRLRFFSSTIVRLEFFVPGVRNGMITDVKRREEFVQPCLSRSFHLTAVAGHKVNIGGFSRRS